jgi:hypothetical protein
MGRLVVNADEPKYELLDRARALAARGIVGLPETPLTAAGYNVRLRIAEPTSELLANMACSLDGLLSDAGFAVESRSIRRTLKVGEGVVNFAMEFDKAITATFNFHRDSSKGSELVDWLKFPINRVEETVALVVERVLRVPVGGTGR